MKRRIRATISGRVQGVGFRPSVYRRAQALGLAGFVRNAPSGVVIEAEGEVDAVERLIPDLRQNAPPQAVIDDVRLEDIPLCGDRVFEIAGSARSGELLAGLPPDLATCEDCRRELLDPNDRRFAYPFIHCTNCGPRFTVARRLPYDRERTSMSEFEMCAACRKEYGDPADRRFDAQLDACGECGPRLSFFDAAGRMSDGDTVAGAAACLREGKIVAVKGVGGYHLCCDARNDGAVKALRERKHRPHKALAVMFRTLADVERAFEVGARERELLTCSARPITILKRRPGCDVSALVSPDTRDAGVFLPYSPLQHLLLAVTGPLVMTSGNRAEEPIVIEEEGLRGILGEIADHALTYNRDIVRRCDDSVARVVGGQTVFIRRSRGYVPGRILLPDAGGAGGMPSVLGCGADLKNTFCVTRVREAFVSQHIGDLEDFRNHEYFRDSVEDLCGLLEVRPEIVAHDMHPDYVSTRVAREMPASRRVAVQHHHAHIASCLAEHGLTEPAIGVALDGLGMGDDSTLWGGEFLVADLAGYRRAAHFRLYPMPGGDEATRHPERMAYACLLTELDGDDERIGRLLAGLDEPSRRTLRFMIRQGVHCPLTSSAGRLFDVAAAMLGLCRSVTYEAQAAIRLETAALDGDASLPGYEFGLSDGVLDFGPAIRGMAADVEGGRRVADIAVRFHASVVAGAAAACDEIGRQEGIRTVALSGGCFQNARLLTGLSDELTRRGFDVRRHIALPPNDACIALGQAAVALAQGTE